MLGRVVLGAVGGHCVRLSPEWKAMFGTVELLFYLEAGRYSDGEAHKCNRSVAVLETKAGICLRTKMPAFACDLICWFYLRVSLVGGTHLPLPHSRCNCAHADMPPESASCFVKCCMQCSPSRLIVPLAAGADASTRVRCSVFVLQRLGKVRFVPYACEPASVFRSRPDLKAYQAALTQLHELEDSVGDDGWPRRGATEAGGGGAGSVLGSAAAAARSAEKLAVAERVRRKAQVSVDWLVEHGVWPAGEADLPGGRGGGGGGPGGGGVGSGGGVGGGHDDGGGGSAFLARFSAAWVHSKIVSAAVPVLEKVPLRDHHTAVDWLRGLLSATCLPARWAPRHLMHCVVRNATMGHQLAGGHSSWCPEFEFPTTQPAPLALDDRLELSHCFYSQQGPQDSGSSVLLSGGAGP